MGLRGIIQNQAWTVTFSLVSSLFVAILVIPMLYDRLMNTPLPPREGAGYHRTLKEAGNEAGRGIQLLGTVHLLQPDRTSLDCYFGGSRVDGADGFSASFHWDGVYAAHGK